VRAITGEKEEKGKENVPGVEDVLAARWLTGGGKRKHWPRKKGERKRELRFG